MRAAKLSVIKVHCNLLRQLGFCCYFIAVYFLFLIVVVVVIGDGNLTKTTVHPFTSFYVAATRGQMRGYNSSVHVCLCVHFR